MELLINNLIDKLDKSEDLLLIELLRQKLNKPKTIQGFDISKRSYSYAKMSITNVLNRRLMSENEYAKKIERLANKYDCENCKYAIVKKYKEEYCGHQLAEMSNDTYLGFNRESKVCISCNDRNAMLWDRFCSQKTTVELAVDNVVTDDIVKLKYVINTLNEKIRILNYKSKI